MYEEGFFFFFNLLLLFILRTATVSGLHPCHLSRDPVMHFLSKENHKVYLAHKELPNG